MAIRHNQDGIVAIVVTIVFLVVISLTALGLARLSRREQRQALDSQLATQALYLAQAGINDAMEAINDPTHTYSAADKSTCDPSTLSDHPELDLFKDGGETGSLASYIADKLGDISVTGQYSCVLISHTLPDYEATAGTDESTVNEIEIIGGGPGNQIFIGWEAASSAQKGQFRSGDNFPPASDWGNTTGVLRADITPLTTPMTRANLDNTLTAFLYPKSGASDPKIGFPGSVGQRTQILNGECNTADPPINPTNRQCFVSLTVPSNRLLLRIKSIYHPTNVRIVAQDNSGTALKIKGQVLIDSTGKVADVVKRLQVRVNKLGDSENPEYAIESVDAICKLLQTQPGNTSAALPAGLGSRDSDACRP